MAGMLPGVECARRRRCHQSITSSDSSSMTAKSGTIRRPSFCLYASNRDFHHSSSSSQQRSTTNRTYQNEGLGEIAREAKERLDERLRTHRKPETVREKRGEGRLKGKEKEKEREIEIEREKEKEKEKGEREENGEKKRGGGKRMIWRKLVRWRASEQEECAVCLDEFKSGEGECLVNLPCAHKFHSRCLVPWLENNGHCPCCRMALLSQSNS